MPQAATAVPDRCSQSRRVHIDNPPVLIDHRLPELASLRNANSYFTVFSRAGNYFVDQRSNGRTRKLGALMR